MNDSGRQRWLIKAVLVGALYFGVGIASIALAAAAPADEMRSLVRFSAFAISALLFAADIAYEHFGLRNTPRPTAWHASVAVALGALALALMANIHDLGSASGYRPKMLIALVAWPLVTAVPAFVVALLGAAGLGVMRRGS